MVKNKEMTRSILVLQEEIINSLSIVLKYEKQILEMMQKDEGYIGSAKLADYWHKEIAQTRLDIDVLLKTLKPAEWINENR